MIVSTETGGLGNRLKSWASAMRLDADARVYWAVTPNMPARFEQLFNNRCAIDAVPEGTREYGSWRLAILPEDDVRVPRGFAVVGSGTHPLWRAAGSAWWRLRGSPGDRYRYMPFPKQHSRRSTRSDGRNIDLEYGRIPEPMRRVYASCFERIEIRPDIANRVDAWSATHLDESVIGVQVRTWRDHARRQRKYHDPSRVRLLSLMGQTPPASRFLVVSDSDEFILELTQQFGAERIVSYTRETERKASWHSAAGIVEDLIDMLLLARTQRFFASYLSTFSEAAWWLGGARASVAVF